MKRNGFVANSSSLSFILKTQDDYDYFTSIYGDTGVYLVEDLKVKFNEHEFSVDDVITEDFCSLELGSFYDVGDLAEFVDRVRQLNDEHWITNAYDRDEASRNGIHFEVFEGDL